MRQPSPEHHCIQKTYPDHDAHRDGVPQRMVASRNLHRALWKNGVRHRDVSPSNLMVYKLGDLWIGVLNDYDLSSTQNHSPSGRERTGMVPFMALDLLTKKAIAGEVEHLYQHDAESLIWVLGWVCLRYEGGKLL
ncbi:hypothetical protein DFH29DRAFT_838758, partial [Suillus ampliporus]